MNCSGLKKIILPESITAIDQYAFYSCINLEEINLHNNITSIGPYAFSGGLAGTMKVKLTNLPINLTTLSANAFNSAALWTAAILETRSA